MAGRRKKLKRPSLGAFRGTMALLTPALPTCRRGGHSVALNHTHHTLSQQSWETNSAGSDCSLSRHCAGHNTLKEATFATSAVGQEAVVTFGSLSQVHRRAVGPPQAERSSQSHGGGGHLHWPLSQGAPDPLGALCLQLHDGNTRTPISQADSKARRGQGGKSLP